MYLKKAKRKHSLIFELFEKLQEIIFFLFFEGGLHKFKQDVNLRFLVK